jgi:DNA polymerase-3 subunit beta
VRARGHHGDRRPQGRCPARRPFTADGTLVLEGGTSDDAQAVDNVDTSLGDGALSIAFNPTYLIDGLAALDAESVQFQFTSSTKPAVMRGAGSGDQTHRNGSTSRLRFGQWPFLPKP